MVTTKERHTEIRADEDSAQVLADALAGLIEGVEEDRREPDKVLCHLQSAKRKLADNTTKLEIEKVTVDGISYTIRRTEGGSTVDTPCSCFGQRGRTHSTAFCPWAAQRGLG